MSTAAEHFPETPMIVCLSREKRLHMKAGDILIYDYLKYRHLWEEARGIFVHHTSAASSIAALRGLGMLDGLGEDDWLSEITHEFDRPTTRDNRLPSWIEPGIKPIYACPIGIDLWRHLRALYPEDPERPPSMQELCPDPDAHAFFDHASTCSHCLKIDEGVKTTDRPQRGS